MYSTIQNVNWNMTNEERKFFRLKEKWDEIFHERNYFSERAVILLKTRKFFKWMNSQQGEKQFPPRGFI